MAKSKSKNPLIIILVIAIIGIAAWFFFSKTVNNKAEEILQQYLIENNLEGKLKWEELQASPTGTANLKKVSFLDEQGEVLMTAEELNLLHYKEDENVLETDAEIKGLVEVKDLGLQSALIELYKLVGVENANPALDMTWQVSLDNTQQKSYMKSNVLLPQLFVVETELMADSPQKIRQLSREINSNFSTEEPSEEEVMKLLSGLNGIKLQGFNIGVTEKGGVEKLREEFLELDADLTSEQQQEQLNSQIADARQECINDASLAAVLSNNQESVCNKVLDFMLGKSDTIKFKVALANPIAFEEFMMMAMMGAGVEIFAESYGLTLDVE